MQNNVKNHIQMKEKVLISWKIEKERLYLPKICK